MILRALTIVVALTCSTAGGHARQEAARWDARAAEHLWNRAGFGARDREVRAAVELGREAFVARLLEGAAPDYEPFFASRPSEPAKAELDAMPEPERKQIRRRVAREEREQLARCAGWWVERMLADEHPLRERMVLFWHGYFTTSHRLVKSSASIVRQNELFRRHALGSFETLLRAIVRDPAMLEYLDNDKNRKGEPNENLARELMELFTLGEGNFTEHDVQEAARALTGWVVRDGVAEFVPRRSDRDRKTILGATEDFDADRLVTLLLEQPACSRWLARKLLVHFEGVEPDESRSSRYASLLARSRYDVGAFLRELFLDDVFYAPERVGTRIAGPVEYLVGSSRRAGIEPPPVLLWLAAGQLGQRLFEPPSVKGWEGGRSWVTTSTLLHRGNVAGMLLGVLRLDDVMRADPIAAEPPTADGEQDSEGSPGGDDAMRKSSATMVSNSRDRDGAAMRRWLADGYQPAIHLTARLERLGVRSDREIVDALARELLPVELTDESARTLLAFLAEEREVLGLADGELLDRVERSEPLLRRLAHLILSLPEAQLS